MAAILCRPWSVNLYQYISYDIDNRLQNDRQRGLIWQSTFLMLRPGHSRRTRSISWLLMPWRCRETGLYQQWYCPCSPPQIIWHSCGISISKITAKFKCLCIFTLGADGYCRHSMGQAVRPTCCLSVCPSVCPSVCLAIPNEVNVKFSRSQISAWSLVGWCTLPGSRLQLKWPCSAIFARSPQLWNFPW